MVIYNVTVQVKSAIAIDFLQWLKEKHIPEMMETGKFEGARLLELTSHPPEGGIAYSIQYFCPNQETLQKYYAEDAERMRAEGQQKFGEEMLAFRTELQWISDFSPKK